MITIRVDMDLDTVSAYEPEVLSLLIAHEIVRDRKVNIWTDCQSAIRTLNGGGLGPLMYTLSGWKKCKSVAFLKVDAHPEKRKTLEEWLPEEKGNYLADQVAGGLVAPDVTISSTKWLAKIASSSKIIVKHIDGPPIITDIRRIKSKNDLSSYLMERDEYRAKDGKPPQWSGSNISLHHKLMGRSNRIGDRVITQRIGLIKRWRWHSARTDNVCEGCGQPISGISHPLRSCCHSDMVKLRDNWWRSVDQTIMSCNRAFHESFFSITRHMRESDGGEIACCGSFTPGFVNQLSNAEVTVSDSFVKSLNRVLKTVVRGTRMMLREAAELQVGPAAVNWNQTAITKFFKPKDRQVVVRRRVDWSDATDRNPLTNNKSKKKNNKIDYNISLKNKNLNISQVFLCIESGGRSYWEFKAG